MTLTDMSPLVVLFDEGCGVCSRLVTFLMRRDSTGDHFRLSGLASETGRKVLAANRLPPDYADSVVVVDGEQALTRSDALISIARRMSRFWRLLAWVVAMVPRSARDRWYDLFAKHRHCFSGSH